MTRDEIYNIVNDWERTEELGFDYIEIFLILQKFPNINMDKYRAALFGNTMGVIKGKPITYPVDLITAIHCGLENRDRTFNEFD